jgi:parallel beta-helix repeat protein
MNNCELRYGGYNNYASILISNAAPTIIDCDIVTGHGQGIYATGNSSPLLHGNTIMDCTGYGIYMTSTGSPVVSGNDVSYGGHGIYADCPAHLDSNTISYCGTGIDLHQECTDIINNTISNCTDWPIKHDIVNRVILEGKGNSFIGLSR